MIFSLAWGLTLTFTCELLASWLALLAVRELALLGVSGVVAIDASQGVDKDNAWRKRASIGRDAIQTNHMPRTRSTLAVQVYKNKVKVI